MRTLKTPGVCRCRKEGCDGSKTIELLLIIDNDYESEVLDDIALWLNNAKKANVRVAIDSPAPPVAALQEALKQLGAANSN